MSASGFFVENTSVVLACLRVFFFFYPRRFLDVFHMLIPLLLFFCCLTCAVLRIGARHSSSVVNIAPPPSQCLNFVPSFSRPVASLTNLVCARFPSSHFAPHFPPSQASLVSLLMIQANTNYSDDEGELAGVFFSTRASFDVRKFVNCFFLFARSLDVLFCDFCSLNDRKKRHKSAMALH